MADAWGGSWGAAWGNSWTRSIAPTAPVAFGGHYAKKKLEQKPRDDTRDDIEQAWQRLTGATEVVEEIVAAPTKEIAPFEPARDRLSESLAVVGQMLEQIGPRIEQARLRVAYEAAREVQRKLRERLEHEEMKRLAALEAARQARLKRFRQAAVIAMHLMED